AGGDRDPARRDRADRPPRRPAVRADAAADRPSARLPGGTGAGRVLTHRHSQVERYTDGLAVTKPQCQVPVCCASTWTTVSTHERRAAPSAGGGPGGRRGLRGTGAPSPEGQ